LRAAIGCAEFGVRGAAWSLVEAADGIIVHFWNGHAARRHELDVQVIVGAGMPEPCNMDAHVETLAYVGFDIACIVELADERADAIFGCLEEAVERIRL